MTKVIKSQERVTLFNNEGSFQNKVIEHTIETETKCPKVGILLVGLGGNNGSTFVAGILANKHNIKFQTKRGIQTPNYFGSFTQCATTKVGVRYSKQTNHLEDVYKSMYQIAPLVSPSDLQIHGWDISGHNLYEAVRRSHVLEPDLINKLKDKLETIVPMPAAFNINFVAANQMDRADNILDGMENRKVVEKLESDIKNFQKSKGLDKVIVLWTANTEKYYLPEISTIKDLDDLIDSNASLPASVLYAYATIKCKSVFLNGSPQNTLHPAVIQLAEKEGAYVGGSDFKSGQTRFKTIMSDFLVGAGLRLSSVVSYNHLGNNDGKNLSEPQTFKSKEISKASVLDDAIKSNPILYPPPAKQEEKVSNLSTQETQSSSSSSSIEGQEVKKNNQIDHCVVIKYVPYVGDSKRALDEYTSQIFLGGHNTISTYNICEDSLLATPIMIDLVVLAEFFTRVKIDNKSLGPVLSYLSFFFKAPMTNHPEYVINSFNRQREMLVNFLKATAGYTPEDSMTLQHKF